MNHRPRSEIEWHHSAEEDLCEEARNRCGSDEGDSRSGVIDPEVRALQICDVVDVVVACRRLYIVYVT